MTDTTRMHDTFTITITGPDPDRVEWEWIAVDATQAAEVWELLGVADRSPDLARNRRERHGGAA